VKKNATLGDDFGKKKKYIYVKKKLWGNHFETCLFVRSVIAAVSDHDLLEISLREVIHL